MQLLWCLFGGSTNAVMHLIAMAHSVDIEITLKDFKISVIKHHYLLI
jgi:dihydroxyacid dehydratase/phosphogluconate dehydratase